MKPFRVPVLIIVAIALVGAGVYLGKSGFLEEYVLAKDEETQLVEACEEELMKYLLSAPSYERVETGVLIGTIPDTNEDIAGAGAKFTVDNRFGARVAGHLDCTYLRDTDNEWSMVSAYLYDAKPMKDAIDLQRVWKANFDTTYGEGSVTLMTCRRRSGEPLKLCD